MAGCNKPWQAVVILAIGGNLLLPPPKDLRMNLPVITKIRVKLNVVMVVPVVVVVYYAPHYCLKGHMTVLYSSSSFMVGLISQSPYNASASQIVLS